MTPDNQKAALEDSPTLFSLVCDMWKSSHLSTFNKQVFETVCYEIGENIGDDDFFDELVFLSELNLERFK